MVNQILMVRSFLLLNITLFFFCSSTIGTFFDFKSKLHSKSEVYCHDKNVENYLPNLNFSSQCESCEKKGCHHSHYCVSHCSGIYSFITLFDQDLLTFPGSFKDPLFWNYFFHYQSPILDPSLKPPLFS